MTDDILAKAEAFIQRRREQLGSIDQPPMPQWPDDIPVLTEVVDDGLPANDGTYFASPGISIEQLRNEMRTELARQLDIWLDENLPQVVVHLLDGIADTLIRQVHDSAREDLLPRLEQALHNKPLAAEE